MTIIRLKKPDGSYFFLKIKREDMYEVIRKNVIGKSVVDVGCADHDCEQAILKKGDFYLHSLISKNSRDATGLDCDEVQLQKLNNLGYNCILGNAETMDLGRKFEVIVASNLIEHLSNPGQFLEGAKRHLEPGGVLVITTPNPFFLWRLVEIGFKGNFNINEEHTCWFDPKTLGYLLLRHGFHIKEMYWSTSYYVKPQSYLVRIVRSMRGYFCSGITVVAEVSQEPSPKVR